LQHLIGPAPQVLGSGHTVHFREAWIDAAKAQVAVYKGQADRGALKNGVEQSIGFTLAAERSSRLLLLYSARRYVSEQKGNVPPLRFVYSEGEDIEPPPSRRSLRPLFEPRRFSSQRDVGEPIEPVSLMPGCDFAHAATHGSRNAREPLKGRIGLQENVIFGTSATVELDLDDAKSLVKRAQDGLIAELAAARRGSYR
jgi:hypothetical protein